MHPPSLTLLILFVIIIIIIIIIIARFSISPVFPFLIFAWVLITSLRVVMKKNAGDCSCFI